MVERWLASKDAPERSALIRSLPALTVSKERITELEEKLMLRLNSRPSVMMRVPARVAFGLVTVAGVAAAGIAGFQTQEPLPQASVTVVDEQAMAPNLHGLINNESVSPVASNVRSVDLDAPRAESPERPAEEAPSPAAPATVRKPGAATPTTRSETRQERLVIEAVRALKRDNEPRRALALAKRYLAESPGGPLSREAKEVLSRARRSLRAPAGSKRRAP